MGEVIVVASGKGGVGKSTFAVNGAAMLAQQGHRVVLIDMNMGLRNLASAMASCTWPMPEL